MDGLRMCQIVKDYQKISRENAKRTSQCSTAPSWSYSHSRRDLPAPIPRTKLQPPSKEEKKIYLMIKTPDVNTICTNRKSISSLPPSPLPLPTPFLSNSGPRYRAGQAPCWLLTHLINHVLPKGIQESKGRCSDAATPCPGHSRVATSPVREHYSCVWIL